MNMQIREIAKTADLKVAYGKDGLDVRVCDEYRVSYYFAHRKCTCFGR